MARASAREGVRPGVSANPRRSLLHAAGMDGGELPRTSTGRFQSTWPRSWSGWASIDRTGWKRCTASVGCSSRRRGDRARSSMPQRLLAALVSGPGGGPNGLSVGHRLDAEPSNRHLHDAFTRRVWPPGEPNQRPGVALTGRFVRLLLSSGHAHATIIPMSSVTDRSTTSRADVLANCSDREVDGCLNSVPDRGLETDIPGKGIDSVQSVDCEKCLE